MFGFPAIKNVISKSDLKKGPVGVFDSGFGGLEILREIKRELPSYDYIYLGDTARAPYGDRPQAEIYRFTKQAVNYLFQQGCPLVVLACNTASAEALRKIQREWLVEYYPERRVLGVIIPACEAAVAAGARRAAVLGTKSTIASRAFVRELKKLRPDIRVLQRACPLLVSLIEQGKEDSEKMDLTLKHCLDFSSLRPLGNEFQGFDALILGCTHYGLIEKEIRQIIGPKIKIISEGRVVAKKLKNYLFRHPKMRKNLSKNSGIKFLTTGRLRRFQRLGSRFFQENIFPIKVKL